MYTAQMANAAATRSANQGKPLDEVLTVIQATAKAGRHSVIIHVNDGYDATLEDLRGLGYEVEQLDAERYQIAWRTITQP